MDIRNLTDLEAVKRVRQSGQFNFLSDKFRMATAPIPDPAGNTDGPEQRQPNESPSGQFHIRPQCTIYLILLISIPRRNTNQPMRLVRNP